MSCNMQRGGKTVYFGELGQDSVTMIDFLERNGAKPCNPKENPADFMLREISPSSSSSADWSKLWRGLLLHDIR